jgi:hypothetical protein
MYDVLLARRFMLAATVVVVVVVADFQHCCIGSSFILLLMTRICKVRSGVPMCSLISTRWVVCLLRRTHHVPHDCKH